ncbi:glucocorticoid receptor-like (DNA-binding domain) [Ceraceosorus guamensis]|uniref:Glucocorticoid receptor-like (DNA-binding domain) n=1 Tax=Ceraceosorus guamensis TaxID=1522189 RepID=A0A316W4E8_9BASI|nr:glucocorticoid receptor-like (DNA-binding domain) [Ceraceosorus guamensis]PWN43511.1 glucocorticoid receptor-like (DNA-binding domain) [Ceraceosorus guamensis]
MLESCECGSSQSNPSRHLTPFSLSRAPLLPNSTLLPYHTSLRRDITTRRAVASTELLRRAYKYLARNTTLPAKTRHQAQLGLNALPPNTRPTRVVERCIATGRGRGVITEFGLCRYAFRKKALANELQGVQKGSW